MTTMAWGHVYKLAVTKFRIEIRKQLRQTSEGFKL